MSGRPRRDDQGTRGHGDKANDNRECEAIFEDKGSRIRQTGSVACCFYTGGCIG